MFGDVSQNKDNYCAYRSLASILGLKHTSSVRGLHVVREPEVAPGAEWNAKIFVTYYLVLSKVVSLRWGTDVRLKLNGASQ